MPPDIPKPATSEARALLRAAERDWKTVHYHQSPKPDTVSFVQEVRHRCHASQPVETTGWYAKCVQNALSVSLTNLSLAGFALSAQHFNAEAEHTLA
jgi:hypothetical protein